MNVPLSSLKKLKAVIFDLDGVIVDSEESQRKTFNEIFRAFGICINRNYWARHYTAVGAYAVMEDVFRRYKIDEDAKKWAEKRGEIYKEHIRKIGLPQVAGFTRLYRLLEKNGIKVAVASGGHRDIIAASLRSIGLPNLTYFGIDDVKRRKPAPDLFLLAARKLRVKPSECIVFEDAPAGFEAAERAGMPCIALTTTNGKNSIKGKAALVIKDFNSPELKKLMLRLASGR